MTVKELMEISSECSPDAKLRIIQEEELECMPEYWDETKNKMSGKATKLYSEDLHSHEMYLLAIEN